MTVNYVKTFEHQSELEILRTENVKLTACIAELMKKNKRRRKCCPERIVIRVVPKEFYSFTGRRFSARRATIYDIGNSVVRIYGHPHSSCVRRPICCDRRKQKEPTHPRNADEPNAVRADRRS